MSQTGPVSKPQAPQPTNPPISNTLQTFSFRYNATTNNTTVSGSYTKYMVE